MNRIIKNIWRIFERYRLSKKNVLFSGAAHFDRNTKFGGNNKIGKNTSVSNSTIGMFTYMGGNNHLDNVEIGSFCSIGSNLSIITSTHPAKNFVSTHPAFYSTERQAVTTFVKENAFSEHLHINGRNLIIGNDVWIGHHVTFIGGIKVGNGAIIGTEALVTKDVPPYSIVGGVPARIIRYRFSEEQIKVLEDYKWWNKGEDWLKNHYKMFSSIDDFIKVIKSE